MKTVFNNVLFLVKGQFTLENAHVFLPLLAATGAASVAQMRIFFALKIRVSKIYVLFLVKEKFATVKQMVFHSSPK